MVFFEKVAVPLLPNKQKTAVKLQPILAKVAAYFIKVAAKFVKSCDEFWPNLAIARTCIVL